MTNQEADHVDHDLSSDMSRPMESLEESIEVNAPLHAVYDQWTQFEEFPTFMEGVESVTQVDDAHVHWRSRGRCQTRRSRGWDLGIPITVDA